MIGRREFITLLGGTAAAWPRAARAQQVARLPTIGFFSPNTRSVASPWTAAFVERLREVGWIEGRTIAIEYRWGEGRGDRTAEVISEFVRLNPDVIVTHGQSNIVAAKEATSAIPIVFALATDPVASGFVASLARPGGNATGLSIQGTDLVGKRLELLREVVPSLRRLAIMSDFRNPEMAEAEAAARMLGLEVTTLPLRKPEDITPAFGTLKGTADALYVGADPLVNSSRVRINILALGARLPTMHGFREAVEVGALLSYGPNFADLFRRAADYVDKILRGMKPAELPVEQPTRFDLVINLTTATALGLTIPEAFLLRADEVIE
jgi:putative tryptophan/tyrosine transport system substrate-binding protein